MSSGAKSKLHDAALRRGDELQQLLAAGADVNARDAEQRTPLHNACQTDPAHVRALLAAGADIEAREIRGMTPLHYAVKLGGFCVEALLEAGAKVDAQDVNGHTPLHHAVAANQDASATRLLASGADPRIADLTGETPVDMLNPLLGSGLVDDLWLADAQQHGPDRLAEHLEKLIDAGIYHRIQMVLEPAQLSGRHSAVRHRGALPLAEGRLLGDHLSAYCAARGAWNSLHALHVSGLPVTFPPPLRDPVPSREELYDVAPGEEALVLLDAANLWGRGLPLLLALYAVETRPALEAALFALIGAPLIDQDKDLRAAKMAAMRAALRALVSAGADLEARGEELAQSLHTALGLPRGVAGEMLWDDERKFVERHMPFAGIMLGLTRPVSFTPLLTAAEKAWPLLPELLSAGASIEASDRFGRNALHLAALAGAGKEAEANLEALLDAGMAVDEADASGWRALTRSARPEIVALLLARGASPVLSEGEKQKLGKDGSRKLESWIRRAQGI